MRQFPLEIHRQPELNIQSYRASRIKSAENKLIVRRFFNEMWNGDLKLGDEDPGDGYVFASSDIANVGSLESLKWRFITYRAAFPDLEVVIEDQIAEGDLVAVRLAWRGSHQAEYEDDNSTGAQIEWTDTAIFRVADGKIVEQWGNSGLASGAYLSNGTAPQAVRPEHGTTLTYEGQIEEFDSPLAAQLQGLVTTQQELLETKDRQVAQLHLLLQQAQKALAIPMQPQKRVSLWHWLLGQNQ